MSRSRRISLCLLSLMLVVAASNALSDTKSDLLALTGNKRTKVVYVRWPWCATDYTPVKAQETILSLENDGNPYTQLMAYDTYDGATRYLDSTLGGHAVPRITRSGSHVIWVDEFGKIAWIRDLAGTSPKRKLIDGGDYFVVACQWNPATQTENVLFESADEKTLYKVPLKADYTVDVTQKTVVYKNTAVFNDNTTVLSKFDRLKVSISEDGAYIGCALPWPKCMMIGIPGGQILSRRADGAFGCEPNIAPDNSYRFFHNRDDHQTLRMWDANKSETNWDVDVVNKVPLPGDTLPYFLDCAAPRWTNDPRFFTNGFPLLGGYQENWGTFDIFKMSAAQVKLDNPSKAGSFCVGKFSADFKTVEGYVRISDGDIRHRDVGGDAWIAGVNSGVKLHGVSNARLAGQTRLCVRGRTVSVEVLSGETVALTLIGPTGHVISTALGTGTVQCPISNTPAGIYLARISSFAGTVVSRLTIE